MADTPVASTSTAVSGINTLLVLGGEGFLGHCLLLELHKRYGTSVKLYSSSRTQRFWSEDWQWLPSDLTSSESIEQLLKQTGAKTVFLAAASHFDSGKELAWSVNVHGTRAAVEACVKAGVRRFIYTSSTAAIFTGKDIINADENAPTASEDDAGSYYGASKAAGERIVLEANGRNAMFTCAIRPASFTGPGDIVVIPQGMDVMKNHQGFIQVGDGTNQCDWDHVDNVTHGHILACEKLLDSSDRSTGSPGPAAGQIFNITGCEPWPLWTYFRRMWYEYNGYKAWFNIVIPFWLAYSLAFITELFLDLFRMQKSGFTRHTIIYATAWRTHNCDKAKRLLGYEPVISTEEGLVSAVKWYKEEEQRQLAKSRQPKKEL